MRYQRIHCQIWHDEKFVRLSNDAKYLFIYLLTSPHSNAIGIYVIPKKYIECDLDWDSKRLAKPFAELLANGLILYDETVSLICIKNQLKHNPIENENQAKSATKILRQLPKSPIFSALLEQLNKPFHEPLRELLHELLREQYGKPETETETVTETEKEIVVLEGGIIRGGTSKLQAPNGEPHPISLVKPDFIDNLKANPAYSHIDIDRELHKMDAWLMLPQNKGRKKTHRFILNWLNKIDKPVERRDDGKPPADKIERKMWELEQRRRNIQNHAKTETALEGSDTPLFISRNQEPIA